MPITPVALALIQRAGEALQKANQQIAQEMAGQSSALVATITSAPFGGEADKALTDLRNVAVVHHELGSLEEKLKTIYLSAMKVTGETGKVEVIQAIAHYPRVRQPVPEAPEDVQPRPVKAKSKAKSSRQQGARDIEHHAQQSGDDGRSADQPGRSDVGLAGERQHRYQGPGGPGAHLGRRQRFLPASLISIRSAGSTHKTKGPA